MFLWETERLAVELSMLMLQDMLELTKMRIAGLGDGSAGKNICISIRAWVHIPSTSVKKPAWCSCHCNAAEEWGQGHCWGLLGFIIEPSQQDPGLQYPGISIYIDKCLHHLAHTGQLCSVCCANQFPIQLEVFKERLSISILSDFRSPFPIH